MDTGFDPRIAVGILLGAILGGCSGENGPAGLSAPDRSSPRADAGRWVAGALHVHSDYSDGAGTPEEIAVAAREAGLDFVLLTDHWSLDALDEGEEGYYGGVLVLVGVEATTEVGHVLGLDLPPTPLRFGRRDAEEVLGHIGELDGFAIVAHPDGDTDSFEWTGWDRAGYEGLELFNAFSAYRRSGVPRSLSYLLFNPFWQTGMFSWEPDWNPELVATWDQMLSGRRLSAWAGTDAHGGIRISDGHFLRWPSYRQVFGMARNYLLLDTPLTGALARDRALIYDALRAGRGFLALDEAGAEGFRFEAEEADGTPWPMGSDVAFAPGDRLVLRAASPEADSRVRLFRDGEIVAESARGDLNFETGDPGVYRAEVRRRVRRIGGSALAPWIASNPISFLPAAQLASRIAANRLPVSDPPESDPNGAEAYPLTLNVEPNPGCTSLDLARDESGEGSFAVTFALGTPPRGATDTMAGPWGRCALSDRRSHDLEGYAEFRFEVRGDAIYRVDLVMADQTRGLEGRFATSSFLTGSEWREVRLPFSRFRSGAARGILDLGRITEISFFFDTTNTRPGTAGRVEVRGVALVPAR